MTHRLRDSRRLLRLSLLSLGLGAVMAPISQFLLWLIEWITGVAFFGAPGTLPTTPVGHSLGLAVVLVPAAGGIIIGFMARYGSPAIRGHGIPEAMEQVLENSSRIPARITWLKPLSAAISIGTGGPFGAEGPIIATGGAGGSLIGQLLPSSPSDRKTLLAAGAAAGMAATFGSPLSAILLAVELLLFEFKARSLVPVTLAVCAAAAIRAVWLGTTPVFEMAAPLSAPSIHAFFALLLIAAIMGLFAFLINKAVYLVEEGFEKLPIHWMWWPALGGLLVGFVGYLEPHTLGVGYDNILTNLNAALPAAAILLLCTLKFVSWSIALGSGTSGGTLAPLMTIGSGLGLLAGVLLQPLVPDLNIHLAALVGMACIFGGASQTLLASAVFAYETTGQANALFPLLAACAVTLLVVRALGKTSIMTEKIARRGISVPAEYGADVFEHTTVGKVMEKNVTTVPGSMPLDEFARCVAGNDPAFAKRQAYPVVNEAGQLAGIITRGDLVRSSPSPTPLMTVQDAATSSLIVTHPGETLDVAIGKLLSNDIGRLPVVDPGDPTRLVGFLSRASILSARWKLIQEEGGGKAEERWKPWSRRPENSAA
ncbi:MAG TPA: chloride channel protein [Chthoniobacteraceae bacterium]|nr:chloride channel protein [Chthoniobacteraceae bacterium]